jgi:hypothetical protein
MESRIIYESDKTYLNKVHWEKPKINSESEWIYLNAEKLTENIIREIFTKTFKKENLYLVTSRNESTEINITDIFSKIKLIFGKIEFRIWDKNFENVLEFKTEVYRKGKASW